MALFLITAPSGSGKTTITNKVNDWKECVSHTTRQMRNGEKERETYYFVSKKEFEKIDMLEITNYDGNLYGLSLFEVDNILCDHKHAYAIVNYEGYQQIKEKYPEAVGIFLHMTKEECLANMLLRGDELEKALSRIELYDEEIKQKSHYDYVIKNVRGSMSSTANILRGIVSQYY